MTTKKTLLNSDLPPLSSYSTDVVGHPYHGTIVSLTPHNAVVEFYAGVRGYLAVSEMSDAYISDATERFRLGQTVRAWVLSVDEPEKKMRLSLKDQAYWSQGGQTAFEALEEGSIVTGTVTAKLSDKIVVDISSGGVTLRAIIPVEHLADTPGRTCEKKLAKIKEGSKLKEVLVLSKNVQNRVVFCSLKSTLIEASHQSALPSKYEDLYAGRKVTGWVKNMEDFGVFIAFAGSVEGVVHRKVLFIPTRSDIQDLPEDGPQDPTQAFTKGQVVSATVIKVDTQLKRSQLSLKSHTEVAVAVGPEGKTEAINPIDQTIKFVEDYSPGRLTQAKIIAIKQTQANVALAENLQGRIDASQITDSVTSSDNQPLKSLEKGAILQVRVLGFHDAKTHKYLAITHRISNLHSILELSCKPSHIKADPLPLPTLDDIKVGSKHSAYINRITEEYVWVNISPTIRGRVHILSLTDNVEKLHNLPSHYPLGSGLEVTVIGKTDDGKYLSFSARKHDILTLNDVPTGSILPGRVIKVSDSGLIVQISETVIGKVGLTDISDNYSSKVKDGYRENSIVRVCVLNVDLSNKKVWLSTRASRTLSSSAKQVDREISSISDIKVGDVIRGFVTNVADAGLFVAFSRNVVGRVLIKDLSDLFLKDWKSHFKVDQLVKAKVLSVDVEHKKIGLSLKQSVVDGKATIKGLDEVQEGDKLTGVVKRVEDYGIFVKLDGYNASGLCHKSEISDTKVGDFRKLYDEGDKVKVLVLSVDPEKKRIALSMKPSHFEDDDDEMDIDDNEEPDEDDAGDIIETDSELADERMQVDTAVPTPAESQGTPLAIDSFNWNGEIAVVNAEVPQSDSESEDDEEEQPQPQKKKHKRSEIKFDKTLSLPLSSAADYERNLLSKPDSSLLWTQYMAHLLQLGEIDKARAIAERALKTIDMREEGEKFNIWISYLNMENSFGTDESLDEVFRRACEYTDKKKLHSHLVSILIKSGKLEKAEELFHVMIKKFSQSCKVWVNYATYLMEHDRVEEGRELLSRSLKILPKRKRTPRLRKRANCRCENCVQVRAVGV